MLWSCLLRRWKVCLCPTIQRGERRTVSYSISFRHRPTVSANGDTSQGTDNTASFWWGSEVSFLLPLLQKIHIHICSTVANLTSIVHFYEFPSVDLPYMYLCDSTSLCVKGGVRERSKLLIQVLGMWRCLPHPPPCACPVLSSATREVMNITWQMLTCFKGSWRLQQKCVTLHLKFGRGTTIPISGMCC